jgi:hypothetical protein
LLSIFLVFDEFVRRRLRVLAMPKFLPPNFGDASPARRFAAMREITPISLIASDLDEESSISFAD